MQGQGQVLTAKGRTLIPYDRSGAKMYSMTEPSKKRAISQKN